MRLVAALMVYLQHSLAYWNKEETFSSDFLLRFFNTISSGGFGVSFFFVLSGFLITYLLLTEQKEKGTIDIRRFYARRILRIWPLYYMVVAFGIIVFPVLKSMMGKETIFESNLIYYWLFLSNFDEINILHNDLVKLPQALSITWSVAIEEQFYLIWPLLFLLISPRNYKFVFPLVILTSISFRIFHAGDDTVMYFHTLSVILDMATGGLAAYLALNHSSFREKVEAMNKTVSVFIYIIGFLGLMYWNFSGGLYEHALARIYFVTYFAFIILHQNYAPHSFLKLSNYKVVSELGRYTYGIYLLHPIAILIIDFIMQSQGIARSRPLVEISFAALGFLITLGLSISSYHLVEKHFLKLKRRFAVIQSGPKW